MNDWPRLLDFLQIHKFPKDQQNEILEDGALWFFNVYKHAGMIRKFKTPPDYPCSRFYDRLKEIGLIVFEKDKRDEVIVKSEKEYDDYLNSNLSDSKINFNKSDFSKIKEIELKNNRCFMNKLKRIALIQYFDDLIQTDQELAELLNQ